MLWYEAIKTTRYLFNMHLTKLLKNKILEQIFIGIQIEDVFHLCNFNTQIFVHIPKHQQSKMDPKATKCIFIGWDETTQGFCCYNQVSKNILIM
jgi:hypothetical protein